MRDTVFFWGAVPLNLVGEGEGGEGVDLARFARLTQVGRSAAQQLASPTGLPTKVG